MINGPANHGSIDFKGWFITEDNKKCEPLTLLDGYSRYLFLCMPVRRPIFAEIRRYLESVMPEYGKPSALRSDNGSPFGNKCKRGISVFEVWLLKKGIWPDKIRPGHPQENGRLERLHRTINEDVIKQGSHNPAEYKELFMKSLAISVPHGEEIYYISESLRHEAIGVGRDMGYGHALVFMGYPLGILEYYRKYVGGAGV